MAKEEIKKLKFYGPVWILYKTFVDFIPVDRADSESRLETADKIKKHLERSDRMGFLRFSQFFFLIKIEFNINLHFT